MPKQISCDTDLSLEDVEEALDELEAYRLIKYWHDDNLIFIIDNFKFARNMIKNRVILKKTIEGQRQLYHYSELWKMFDQLYSAELQVINASSINHQSNKNKNKHNNKYKTHNNINRKACCRKGYASVLYFDIFNFFSTITAHPYERTAFVNLLLY